MVGLAKARPNKQHMYVYIQAVYVYMSGFLSGGAGEAFAPPWLWLAPPWEF